jgi:hypothetical protein
MPWINFKCKTCKKIYSDFIFLKKEENPFYQGGFIYTMSTNDSIHECPYCSKPILDRIRQGNSQESGED